MYIRRSRHNLSRYWQLDMDENDTEDGKYWMKCRIITSKPVDKLAYFHSERANASIAYGGLYEGKWMVVIICKNK